MNRRIRDTAFTSLVRQEASFFDMRAVGKITSELQEDATRVQTYSGDPIRQFLLMLSSLFVGLVLAFYFMWPLALLTIGVLPVMGWAQSLEMEKTMGKDETEKDEEVLDGSTPGGIAVETLLNMGTVAALTMQDERYNMYEVALGNTDTDWMRVAFKSGILAGLSMGVQQWVFALLFYVGGVLIDKYPTRYDFLDLNIALFGLLFGLFGLGIAFQDVADKKETEESASRIFYLMDRKSSIDPLSDEGKEIDYSAPIKSKKPKSSKSFKKKSEKKKRASSLKDVNEEEPEDEEEKKQRSSSSKKKKSSKKLLDESEDGAEKKPKSTKKKKKKSKKNDSLPSGESEDIVFVPPGDSESERNEE